MSVNAGLKVTDNAGLKVTDRAAGAPASSGSRSTFIALMQWLPAAAASGGHMCAVCLQQ
jgi:hypothetical protein